MTDFTPPKPKSHNYATWIQGRRKEFKVHSTKGLAKTAITNCIPSKSVLYELQGGEWVEIEGGYTPKPCSICGEYGGRYRSNYTIHPSESTYIHGTCKKLAYEGLPCDWETRTKSTKQKK